MTLEQHAYKLLKSDNDYLQDAIEGMRVGNTVVGSVMSIATGSPRWATEEAVRVAVARIAKEKRS